MSETGIDKELLFEDPNIILDFKTQALDEDINTIEKDFRVARYVFLPLSGVYFLFCLIQLLRWLNVV